MRLTLGCGHQVDVQSFDERAGVYCPLCKRNRPIMPRHIESASTHIPARVVWAIAGAIIVLIAIGTCQNQG